MKELAQSSREALDAYREELTPDEMTIRGNRNALARRVADGELPLALPDDPTPEAADGRRAPVVAWVGALVAIAAAVVAVVVVQGRVLTERDGSRLTPAARYERGGATGGGGSALDRDPGPEVNSPEMAATPQPAAEAVLVGQARAALRDKNPNTALRLIQTYRQRYPGGDLWEEAEVVRLAALCDVGRAAEARAAAMAFVKARPRSPLSGHARRICANRPESR